MDDLISRQAAIDAIEHRLCEPAYQHTGEDWYAGMNCAECELYDLPSAQAERTEYIPDTKAVRSKRDCVDLSERVSATFFDQEHEEWTQRIVTIADVLDSVCDEYTILPSAQTEIIRCRDCKYWYAGENINYCRKFWDDDGEPKLYRCTADDFCSRAERKDNDRT